MRALQFLTGHSAFKLSYNQIYQLKTTMIFFIFSSTILLRRFGDFKSQQQFILSPPEVSETACSESLGISTKEAVTTVYFSF